MNVSILTSYDPSYRPAANQSMAQGLQPAFPLKRPNGYLHMQSAMDERELRGRKGTLSVLGHVFSCRDRCSLSFFEGRVGILSWMISLCLMSTPED